ncbi:short transient receptor potential channel 5-like isoform X2, partial [Paramuricea clavata]
MSFPTAPDSNIETDKRRLHGRISEKPASNVAEFFDAVKSGNIDLVKSKLDDTNNPVNINAMNSDGETALQIAAKNSNFEIMKELLAKKANLKNALLQCIIENDLECVKILLANKPGDIEISKDSYITPIILAAQLGHYDIVDFFIQNNCVIEEPHGCECACEKECEEKSHMFRSQIAINRFRGLSNPVYMCLRYLKTEGSNDDPLTRAFDLNTKVRERASHEPELKKEYLKISERCKRFATDLYNGCQSMNEIASLLDIDEDKLIHDCRDKRLNGGNRDCVVKKLRTAVKSGHIEFVAHPLNQQLLNTAVYSGVPRKIYGMPFKYKVPLFLLYTVIFPLLVLFYIVTPDNTVSKMMKTPYFKFISHISQFIMFQCLIAASALRDTRGATVIEYLIFITVFGMMFQEGIKISKDGFKYIFNWWNGVTAIMLTLLVLAGLSWIVGVAIIGRLPVVNYSLPQFAESKVGYQFLFVGNSCFSMAIVASVFYLFELCQVNHVIGPLQLSLFRMLQDVLKFLLFFGAIFLAFVIAIRNLYSHYHSIQEEIAEHNNKNNSMVAETNHRFST